MSRIIFYDGLCPMCNGWVTRLLRWDRKGVFSFAPLQGDTAGRILAPVMPDYLREDTIILFDRGRIYLRSEAVLQILRGLGFPASMGFAGKIIPKTWRDGMYRRVATRRYAFGPRYADCPLPPKAYSGRFLS